MVKYREDVLDRTFAALSDPTRRALLARLGGRESLSVSELAQPFSMSLPAIMKHLDVLSDAGLIAREKTGRTVACRLTAQPMEQAMEWLNRYQRFWSDALDRLAAFWRKTHGHPVKPDQVERPRCRARRAPQPHAQAPVQRGARKSLRRVGRPAKTSAMVRARLGRGRVGQGRYRSARRRPLPHQLQRQGHL